MTTSADDIRADIVATRAELAETADALAARLEERSQIVKRVALAVTGAAVLLVVVQRIRKR